MRHLCASAAVVILILGVLSPPLSLGQTPGTTRSGAPLYMGVGSCAAVQCHGSLRELTTSKAGVRQTEHPHWLFKEKHAKAYEVLLKDRSLVMAKNLNMAEPPAQSERCLVCHAMYAPREARGPKFQLEDGVSCEACHGPAGVWLENHIDRK